MLPKIIVPTAARSVLTFKPRKGQWIKLHLREDATVLVKAAGAFVTKDDFFLSIYSPAHVSYEGAYFPDRLMLVDDRGDNVAAPINPKLNLWASPKPIDDEALVMLLQTGMLGVALDMRPMVSKLDFPPRYVGNTAVDPKP